MKKKMEIYEFKIILFWWMKFIKYYIINGYIYIYCLFILMGLVIFDLILDEKV